MLYSDSAFLSSKFFMFSNSTQPHAISFSLSFEIQANKQKQTKKVSLKKKAQKDAHRYRKHRIRIFTTQIKHK